MTPALILLLSRSSFNSLVVKCQPLGSCNTKEQQDEQKGEQGREQVENGEYGSGIEGGPSICNAR